MVALKILEPLIVAEWDRWSAETGGTSYMSFYAHLKNNRAELLEFRTWGAPERKVKEILMKAGRI